LREQARGNGPAVAALLVPYERDGAAFFELLSELVRAAAVLAEQVGHQQRTDARDVIRRHIMSYGRPGNPTNEVLDYVERDVLTAPAGTKAPLPPWSDEPYAEQANVGAILLILEIAVRLGNEYAAGANVPFDQMMERLQLLLAADPPPRTR
jgi:hypothetical protein